MGAHWFSGSGMVMLVAVAHRIKGMWVGFGKMDCWSMLMEGGVDWNARACLGERSWKRMSESVG